MFHRASIMAAILMVATAVASCVNPNAPQIQSPLAGGESRTFDIPVGQSVDWSERDLRVTFDRVVHDSRCPVGGMCVWAGNAVLSLTANPGGTFSIRLGPPAGMADPTSEVVELSGFRYRAVALEPIAGIGRPPVDPATYVVTLEVTRIR